jgi:hypothetical protein
MSFIGIGHNNPPKTKRRKGGLCYCHTCDRDIHSLGIMGHRAAHRRRGENCKITFSTGDTYSYTFTTPQEPKP